MTDYLKLSETLARDARDFIIHRATQNQLGLVASRWFWSEKERWGPVISEFDDIGDYLIFICWYGIEFGDKECLDFTASQIDLWEKYFKLPCGLFITQYDHNKNKKIPGTAWQIVSLHEHRDALLGLVELYRLTGEQRYLKLACGVADATLTYVNRHRGLVPNKVIPALKLGILSTSSFSAVCGLFAEELTELYTITKESRFLEGAKRIIASWLNTPLFKKSGLFATGYHPYFRSLSVYRHTELMKSNTNMIYALLYLYEITGEPVLRESIDRWFSSLLRFRREDGSYYGVWDSRAGQLGSRIVDKTQNFAIIDAYLDAYRILGEERFLKLAEECAHFWISQKNKTTKLIPEQFRDGAPVHFGSKIDQNVDLYTCFLKLFDMTRKEVYLKNVKDGLEVFDKFYRTKSNWWHRLLDYRSGQLLADEDLPPGENPAEMNLTKYVGLPIRFFISANKVLRGQPIYSDEITRYLIRDR
jgi:rhamnogalacturonyl hydrolase YesR